MEEMTERFARDGYFAMCPDLYHRDGPDCKDDGPTRRGRARDTNIINDINATMAHLRANKLVDSKRVAILGFCMGGRVAYLMAAASKDFKAAHHLVWRQLLSPVGRGADAVRAHRADFLSDPRPFRRHRSESDA